MEDVFSDVSRWGGILSALLGAGIGGAVGFYSIDGGVGGAILFGLIGVFMAYLLAAAIVAWWPFLLVGGGLYLLIYFLWGVGSSEATTLNQATSLRQASVPTRGASEKLSHFSIASRSRERDLFRNC